jgi:hypothetical protein
VSFLFREQNVSILDGEVWWPILERYAQGFVAQNEEAKRRDRMMSDDFNSLDDVPADESDDAGIIVSVIVSTLKANGISLYFRGISFAYLTCDLVNPLLRRRLVRSLLKEDVYFDTESGELLESPEPLKEG